MDRAGYTEGAVDRSSSAGIARNRSEESPVDQSAVVPVNDLLARAQREGTPLIDGEIATFLWRGTDVPQLTGDFNRWGREHVPFEEGAAGLWCAHLTLPLDGYFEYSYRSDVTRQLDPLNPRVSEDMGDPTNYFAMPAWQEPSLIAVAPDVPRGTTSQHVMAGNRVVRLYRPPASGRSPLVVVLDGAYFFHSARITEVVDNLIHQQRIRPIALAMISQTAEGRLAEYDCSEATLSFLVDDLLPLAGEHLDLTDAPGAHGVLGTCLAGAMALYAGLRRSDVFGHVLCQAGPFHDQAERRWRTLLDLICQAEVKPLKIWMDCGIYDHVISANREMSAALRSRGYDIDYREFHGGHNHTSWRGDYWRGIEALYGYHCPPEAKSPSRFAT
jgi:enterochelin esterase-like enzyme